MKEDLLTNFIPINRKLFEHYLWCEEREYSKFEAWLFLMKEARFEDTKLLDKGKLVLIKRGQVYVSIRFLSNAFGWTKKRVETFIKLLVSDGMIATETVKETGQSMITICNYDKYNVLLSDKGTAKGTPRGQQGDTEGTKSNRENIENKVNSISLSNGETRFIAESLIKTMNILLSDKQWLDPLCMNNQLSEDKMKDYIKLFFVVLQGRAEIEKTEYDAKDHFCKWLAFQKAKKGGTNGKSSQGYNRKPSTVQQGMAGIETD